MKLASIMIGIMLFSLFIIGTASFMGAFSTHYNINIEPGWENEYDFLNKTSITAKNMTDIFGDEHTNWAEGGLRMGYSAVKLIFITPKFVSGIFQGVAERLQIPTIYVTYIVVIFTILIIFLIAQALVRWYL